MLRSVKVQDYMTQNLITFRADTDLFTAINTLRTHKISGAPVIDAGHHVVGMLADIDCLKAILTLTYHEEEKGGVVGDYMAKDVTSITEETDIIEVSEAFISRGLRRLPVLRAGKLVGQISRSDVLRAVEEFAQE